MKTRKAQPKKKRLIYKDYVRRLCNDFRSLVFAGEYYMNIKWADEDLENRGLFTNASIWIDPTYLRFDITCYPNLKRIFENDGYERVARTLLHEMCHLFTEPLYDFACEAATKASKEFLEEIRERQTQRICNAIMQFVKKSDYMP